LARVIPFENAAAWQQQADLYQSPLRRQPKRRLERIRRMSQRISLTRVIAINWYGFRQIFDVERQRPDFGRALAPANPPCST
jgi:hypothetical protein